MARSKRVIFLRHGQSLYNAAKVDPMINDAALTEKGRRQAKRAARKLKRIQGVELVVVSPLTRALQTMEIALRSQVEKGTPVFVNPLAREITCGSDDLGSTPEQLQERFPSLDFSHLDRVWWYTGTSGDDQGDPNLSYQRYRESEFDEPKRVYQPRLAALKKWILKRKEPVIVVVAHNRVIEKLTGVCAGNCEIVHTIVRGKNSDFETFLEQKLVICDRFVKVVRMEDKHGDVALTLTDWETGKEFKGTRGHSTQAVLDSAVAKFNKYFGENANVQWKRSDSAFIIVGSNTPSSSSSSSSSASTSS